MSGGHSPPAQTTATIATTVRSRPIDEHVARELLANARDELMRDFGLGAGLGVGVTAGAFLLGGVVVGSVAVLLAPVVILDVSRRLAIRRRRRRCRELGVDANEVDRLFAGIDLVHHVATFHRFTEAAQAALVARIVAGDLRDTGTHGVVASARELCPRCEEPALEIVRMVTWSGRADDGSRTRGATSYARCSLCAVHLKMEIGWPWEDVSPGEWERRVRADEG